MLRLISRVDVRNGYHIKTMQCEGVRQLRKVEESIRQFGFPGRYEADEIVVLDTVASLYERPNTILTDKLPYVPIPVVVGGGIRTVEDAYRALEAGSEKLLINSAALERPDVIEELASRIGRQAIVLQLDVRKYDGSWVCYGNGAREPSAHEVSTWVPLAESLGAGEIMVTSIDAEGTGNGLNLELLQIVSDLTDLPVIASGGIGCVEHILNALEKVTLSGVAFSYLSNVALVDMIAIRESLTENDRAVRIPVF